MSTDQIKNIAAPVKGCIRNWMQRIRDKRCKALFKKGNYIRNSSTKQIFQVVDVNHNGIAHLSNANALLFVPTARNSDKELLSNWEFMY